MTEVSLGKTGITVNKNGFGALPIQRIPQDDAVKLVRRAFERGINFFDTARSYTDSEAKLGVALRVSASRYLLRLKHRLLQQQDSGMTWKPVCACCKLII